MPLERDSLLYNRYRILETLGQGGMGAVYRAMDENLGVEVAVKENLFSSDESTRQFRREATILASMRHNNLPRVSDHFEIADQGQYLVMDYIEGEDLHQRMNRVDTLPEEEVIVIGAAICDALSYMHNLEPPILHRDIKPGNIKIDPAGGVYLVDFGLAKIMQGSQTTTTGARAMTPGYSSPEQYGMARTDVRSDIYSLGATLYAAVTGTIPEDGLARAMEQADLTPARKRNSKVSRRIAQVIDTSLEIHPDDRYQTAEAFKQAMLEASSATRMRAEAGELTIQPPPPEVVAAIAEGKAPKPKPVAEPEIKMSGESKTRRRRRKVAQRRTKRRTMIRRLTLLAIVGIAGLYAAVVTGTIDDIFGLQLAVAPPSKAATATHTQAPATLEASATSEPLVVEASATATPQPSATSTAPQPTDTPVPLEDTPAAGTATPLLPPPTRDGAVPWVAFVSTRGGLPQIWLVDTAGNGLTQLTDLEGGACQPDWSPDAARVVFISPCDQDKTLYLDANLYTINADGSDLQPLPTPVGSFDPAWSPDGSRILYTAAADANHAEIASLTLADGSITA
ncbi:MAG: protein kinase, partial [Anaerolineae bacterium]|nr:protein kinase [Anaerolineae bacterium]